MAVPVQTIIIDARSVSAPVLGTSAPTAIGGTLIFDNGAFDLVQSACIEYCVALGGQTSPLTVSNGELNTRSAPVTSVWTTVTLGLALRYQFGDAQVTWGFKEATGVLSFDGMSLIGGNMLRMYNEGFALNGEFFLPTPQIQTPMPTSTASDSITPRQTPSVSSSRTPEPTQSSPLNGPNSPDPNSPGLSAGALAGIIVGSIIVAFTAIIIGAVLIYRRKKAAWKPGTDETKPNDTTSRKIEKPELHAESIHEAPGGEAHQQCYRSERRHEVYGSEAAHMKRSDTRRDIGGPEE